MSKRSSRLSSPRCKERSEDGKSRQQVENCQNEERENCRQQTEAVHYARVSLAMV